MVTAPCILPSFKMCQIEVMASGRWSVQTTHASAIMVYLSSCCQEQPLFLGKWRSHCQNVQAASECSRCAMRMRSQEKDRAQTLILLRKNRVNGHLHCSGIHTHCNYDFFTICTTARDQQQPISSSYNDGTEDGEDPNDIENGLKGSHKVAYLWNYNSTTLIMLHFLIDGGGAS